jgi:hypothetical protein
MISDNTKSVFPQLVTTERPDRVVSMLNYGQVAILSEGSPQALLGPTGISEYFVSPEDYYLSWVLRKLNHRESFPFKILVEKIKNGKL